MSMKYRLCLHTTEWIPRSGDCTPRHLIYHTGATLGCIPSTHHLDQLEYLTNSDNPQAPAIGEHL